MSASDPGVRRTTADDLSLTVVLPGSWAKIPLDSAEVSNAAIGELLRERMPRRDELAGMRREVRGLLRQTADAARTGGAVLLLLSLELLPGIPFSSSIVAAYVDAPSPPEGVPLEVLLAVAAPESEILSLDIGTVARTTRRAPDEATGFMTITIEYLVPSPQPGRFLRVLADVPGEIDPALVVELFDLIVGTIRWFRETSDDEAHDDPR